MNLQLVVKRKTESTVGVRTLEFIRECFLSQQKTFLYESTLFSYSLNMSVIHSLNGHPSITKVKVPFEFSIKGVPGKP